MPRKKVLAIGINDWCKKCGICVHFCPTGVFASGSGGMPVVVNLEACTVCRLCELRCPDFAIRVEAAGEEVRDAAAAVDAR